MTLRHTNPTAVDTGGKPGSLDERTAKLPYQRPRVIDYGSLTELTGSATGTMLDGAPFMATGVNP